METRTIELVSNASLKVYPDNSLSSFVNFLPEQLNFEGEWEVALSEISFPVLYQNVTVGKFRYKSDYDDTDVEPMYLEPGIYTSLQELLWAMIQKIQERKGVDFDPFWFEIDERTQKVEFKLPNEGSNLIISSLDLAHILGYNSGAWLRSKGPHYSSFVCDILRIHSLMIYTDIIEYNIIGDTKAPLLRCFPLMSKLKEGSSITPSHFMNYQTFQNLQYKKLLKNSFHSVQVELRDDKGELLPFLSIGITRLTLVFRKSS